MKKITFALVLVSAIASVFSACKKESLYEIKFSDNDSTFVSKEVGKNSGSLEIKLKSSFDYEVAITSSENDWITIKEKNRERISLEYSKNDIFQERTAIINLCKGSTAIASIAIEQAAADVVLKYKAPENNTFRRVAYFPYYRNLSAAYIPDEYLKTCNVAVFAFAYIKSNYSVYVEKPAMLQELVRRCRALGVEKVLLSFSGTNSIYREMVKKGSRRVKFVNDMVKFVDLYKLDGIDNDWEYPSASNNSKNDNLMMMRLFSNILHSPERNQMLTMAITDGRWDGGYRNGIDPGVYDCCDFFNNMSYNSVLASDVPSKYDACKIMETSYNWWVVTRKMPAKKFVLGLPLYGTDPYADKNMGYATILKNGGDPDKDIAQFTLDGKAYTYYYNGRPTIRKKVETMKSRGCGGYMFWEGSFDSFDENSILMEAYNAANEK